MDQAMKDGPKTCKHCMDGECGMCDDAECACAAGEHGVEDDDED